MMRVLRRDGTVCELSEDQILYITTFQKVITVHTRDGEYIFPTTFEHVQRVIESLGFAKLDRSFLVQLEKISRYDAERRVVHFDDAPGISAPVSEPNVAKVVDFLKDKKSETP